MVPQNYPNHIYLRKKDFFAMAEKRQFKEADLSKRV